MTTLSHTRRHSAVIFDGDDTLWATQPLYEHAKDAFFNDLQQLGFAVELARESLRRREESNLPLLGYSRERFPRSMVETYRELTALAGRVPSAEIEAKLRDIAMSVFRKDAQVDPEASAVLSSLRLRHKVILATKGDHDVQLQRVARSGLGSLFDAQYILERKGTHELLEILTKEQLSPDATWVVGDSLRSDVWPALTLGLRAVWLRRETWFHEEAEQPQNPRLHEVDRLSDVLDVPGLL